MDRRQFLRLSAAATAVPIAGGLLAACGDDGGEKSSTATTSKSGPLTPVKFGFIALTDAAPLIMAKELGYFAERGIDAQILKQASWPVLRDALLSNQIDAAHGLYTLPFSVATGLGGAGSRDLRLAMMLNQNGQAITLGKEFAEVGYGKVEAAGKLLNSKDAPSLAMTFPGGTHDLWIRYWVKASGADASKLKIGPVPPPQMVQNMSVGAIQGYCVGEPWNAVAVQQGIGFTHLATQDLWDFHPEKGIVTTAKFETQQRDALKRSMGAILQAGAWLDKPANRAKAADTLGLETYVNAPANDIRGRLTGTYNLGAGLGTKDFKGRQMQFFRDGEVSFPRKAHAIWAMAQYGRLGLLKDAPAYTELADELILTDLYKEVAKAEGISVPDDDMSPFEVKLDDAKFDPAKPGVEVKTRMTTAIETPIRLTPGTETGRKVVATRRAKAVLTSVGWGLVGVTTLIVAWALVATRVDTLPTPGATWATLRHLLADPFYDHGPNDKGIGLQLLGSLQRVGTGFGFAALVGIPVGLAMGSVKQVWKAANPVIQLLRPVSPLAWFPIWLIVLKNAPHAATVVIFITALWPIIINTASGAATVPHDQRSVARVFRFTRFTYVRHVLVPHTLPSIVTGMRLSMGVAWMVIVAVEMLSGGVGVGSFVWNVYNALDLSKVIAAIALIGIVGVGLDFLFMRLGRLVALEEGNPS